MCWPLATGTADPKGVCGVTPVASCGTNGKCDGAGGCQKYAEGTMCSSPTCPAGAFSMKLAGTCSGGACTPAGMQSCNGYKCTGGAACPMACVGDSDCDTSSYHCSVTTNVCVPNPATCPAGVLGHCNAETTAAPVPTGYTLALAEEFDTPIDLNNDPIWTWSDASPSGGQTRFAESQVTFANGKMVITASSPCAAATNNPGCIPGSPSYASATRNMTTSTIAAMGVSSGEMRTKYNNYRYGWYEARFHAPIANQAMRDSTSMNGGFMSTLYVFRTPFWQEWNEIDIELIPNILGQVASNVVNATNVDAYPSTNASASNITTGLPVAFKDYDTHTYALSWTPTAITWYVDGQQVRSFAGTASVPIPTNSTKIMMNLWVFSGAAFGDPKNNVYPFSAEYEYFRFYKWNSEITYPCAATPSCVPPGDLDYSQNNPKEVNYGQ
jgi:beta-glucanase (GH16 family)